MSMETLNVIQFIELLIGFLGFTVGLPALVFYKKAGKILTESSFKRKCLLWR